MGWMDTHPHNSGATNKKGKKKAGPVSSGLVTLLALFARTQMRTDGCPTWPPSP